MPKKITAPRPARKAPKTRFRPVRFSPSDSAAIDAFLERHGKKFSPWIERLALDAVRRG